MPTEEIKARGADCLWPSSASAQSVFDSLHSQSDFPGYRAETVLQSPEVIYAGPQGTDALVRAGLVEQPGGHLVVDVRSLLIEYVLRHRTWESIVAKDLRGPIAVASTDAAKSNSGFTLAQLQLNVIATNALCATSAQVRNIRTLNYGLGQRLALLVNLTIPTMKLTIAQWGLLLQANQAADMQQAVTDGANDVPPAYASAAGTAVPKMAKLIQTQTIRPETIIEVADSIDAQAKGIEDAVKYGRQRRAEVITAIVTAQESMSASSQRLNKTVVELVAKPQKPLELPAAPTIPDAVAEQARLVAPVTAR